MAITTERYQEVDAELKAMGKRLLELSMEIDVAAPITDKHGFTYQFAQQVSAAIAHLRHMLKMEQMDMGRGKRIRQRLYAKHKR